MALRKFILKIILLGTLLSNAATADAQYNKDYFYWASRRCLMNREYQEAIRVLNILLRADPDAAEGYFLRGVAKFNLDDLLGADTDFSAAIVKNPVFTTAYIYRALTRTRMGNYDDALQDFREAIDLRPDLPDAYYSRGYTRLQNKQYEEAIEDFDKFIFQENKVADAYIGRGTAYLYLKDTVRALENFDQAIRTNRENPNGYYQRGTLLLQKEEYARAEADFDMSIRCDSTFLPPYFNRAVVYSNTNRPMQRPVCGFRAGCYNWTRPTRSPISTGRFSAPRSAITTAHSTTSTAWRSTPPAMSRSITCVPCSKPAWAISKAPSATTPGHRTLPRLRQRLPEPQRPALCVA